MSRKLLFDWRKFKRFLRDTQVAVYIGIGAFGIGLFLNFLLHLEEVGSHKQRIALFRAFIDEEHPAVREFSDTKSSSEERFAWYLKLFFGEDGSRSWRYILVKTLASEEFSDARVILADITDAERTALFSGREDAIMPLVREEEETVRGVEAAGTNWRGGLVFAGYVWGVVSVLCLLLSWRGRSYAMSYFPLNQWWFWGYAYLAFPASAVLGVGFAVPYLFGVIGWMQRVYGRYRDKDTEFKKMCAELSRAFRETEEKWMALFPNTYIAAQIPVLEKTAACARETLKKLEGEISSTEEKYSRARTCLAHLRAQQPEFMARERMLKQDEWREEWRREIERIAAHRDVEAVCIKNETLIVYSKIFCTAAGFFGPMMIEVRMYEKSHSLIARYAHAGAHRANISATTVGGGGGDFCFGSSWAPIRALLDEFQVSEAVFVALRGLQASAINM